MTNLKTSDIHILATNLKRVYIRATNEKKRSLCLYGSLCFGTLQ